MSTESGERPEAEAAADAAQTADAARFGAAFAAGAGMLAALRRIATAVAALLVAEARVLRASIALVVLGIVALTAFSVSLWACVVALIGWGLAVATGSAGIALGILVVLHMVLVVAIWSGIKLAIRRASFPEVRAELRALGGELRRDVSRFQHAQPPQAAPAESEHPP
ncbi:MAG: hypothetical protein OJF55_002433 [Rhodanobacteraceae bacterium]|jgi:hypothetical protein|nr:MAG: hypothetical protein OJF55_002433 [Rhodanobacteraceae bacterium]